MRTLCYSIKQTGFLIPLVPGLQNSLDNADAHIPIKEGCPPPLINSTAGHYNSIGAHSISLWLVFLATVQYRKGELKTRAQQHKHAQPCLSGEVQHSG